MTTAQCSLGGRRRGGRSLSLDVAAEIARMERVMRSDLGADDHDGCIEVKVVSDQRDQSCVWNHGSTNVDVMPATRTVATAPCEPSWKEMQEGTIEFNDELARIFASSPPEDIT